MNISSVSMNLHTILMRMMDKVDETTKRNLILQKEEIEKRAEMKATEKYLSFREMLNSSINSNSEKNTDREAIGTGSDGVNIAIQTFPQNYSEHRQRMSS